MSEPKGPDKPKKVPFVGENTLREKIEAVRAQRLSNRKIAADRLKNRKKSREAQAVFSDAYAWLGTIEDETKTVIREVQERGESRLWIYSQESKINTTLNLRRHQSIFTDFFDQYVGTEHLHAVDDALETWLQEQYGNAVWLVDTILNSVEDYPDSERGQPRGLYLVVGK